MITLSGLHIAETLYEDERIVLCRGVKTAENIPILVKTIKNYPADTAVAMLEKEKAIIDVIAHDGIIKPLEIIPHRRNPALILEDFPGRPLALTTLPGRLDIPRFLSLGLRLAKILAFMHEKQVIHNNITPWAIFVNDHFTAQAHEKIAIGISLFERSFSLTDDPEAEMPAPSPSSLAYLSPESARKSSRVPDARSDLYSLGAVLYELATGRPPFSAGNPADLVYALVSEMPVAPKRLRSGFPAVVSRIIMGLLEKNPDERYQSAQGLAADLKKCLSMSQKGRTVRSFPLGRFDAAERLRIPDKLYDREAELTALSGIYDETCGGKNIFALVAGHAGTGKTALVMGFREKAIGEKSFFISGKFDQYHRDIPLLGFTSAFGGLMRRILTRGDEEIHAWKIKIIEALRPNARLIIDLIPELEIVIGSQEPVQKTDPVSAMNRLYRYVQKFMAVFAEKDHPLIIFLDDLHWADSASLDLLKIFATSEELHHFCVIGAYRDNEVIPDHPLAAMLETIGREKEIITITANPISREAVRMLVAETFGTTPGKAKALSDLVHDKTMGNPFFVREFLLTIGRSALVPQDPEKGWRCDIDGVRRLPAADNVLYLLSAKIKELPVNERKCIMTAACIGSTFECELLSRARTITEKEATAELRALMAMGMIIHENEGYRFIHDRIQEAAYLAMTPEGRIETHYRIGKILFEDAVAGSIIDNIFAVVDHLNHASEIVDEYERIVLADLNYVAGKKAKSQAAFEMSLKYLRNAHKLSTNAEEDPHKQMVAESIWKQYYHFAYVVHLELAEAEYLNGNFNCSEEVIQEALPYIISDIEKAPFYNILILQYTLAARYPEAIEIGFKALTPFGIEIDTWLSEKTIADAGADIDRQLAGRDISSILELPPMTDIKIHTVIKILRILLLPIFYLNPAIADLISIKICSLSIEFGNAPESLTGYLHYGMVLSCRLGNIEKGYQMAKIALDLSHRFGNKAYICESSLKFANFIAFFRMSLKQIEELNRSGFQAGLESGEMKYAGDTYGHIILNLYNQGKNLNHVYSEASKFLNFISRTKDQLLTPMIEGLMFVIRHLKETTIMDTATFSQNHEKIAKSCTDNDNLIPLYVFYCHEAQMYYLLGEFDRSLGLIIEGARLLQFFCGFFGVEMIFYESLTLASLYPQASEEEKNEFMATLSETRQKLKLWSESCPENFLHKYLLVEAEVARVTGRDMEAVDLYDRSIEDADKNEFTQDQAVAGELAGRFWLEKGKKEIAGIYIAKAYELYKKWGALRKSRDCEEKYPDLINNRQNHREPAAEAKREHDANAPELIALLQISQDIMREIHLDKLLEKILTSAVKHSSAQRGCILMEKNRSFFIEAEISPKIRQVELLHSAPLRKTRLPLSIIRYAAHSGEGVILSDAAQDPVFKNDPYVLKNRPRSILCRKIEYLGKTEAIIYLENRIVAGAFGDAKQDVLDIMSAQTAIALENARLYKKQEETLSRA
ncbi:MAG: hypothetical protein A2W19_02980, partial [Spirochaetes bacterium RBG_16_49_21]